MKLKNVTIAFTLAMAALAAPFGSYGSTGDIYEIRPVSEAGKEYQPGEKFRFNIRFLSRSYDQPSPAQWGMVHVGPNSEMWDFYNNPLQIGIVVSGHLRYAKVVDGYPSAFKTAYTDLVCEYQVQPGEIAFPVRLALKGSTEEKPIIAGTDESTTEYCVKNTEFWAIKDTNGNLANFTYCTDARASECSTMWTTGTSRDKDVDLTIYSRFYVKGVQFDPTYEAADKSVWRTVHKGTTTTALTPKVMTIGSPTNSVKLYVWSENEDYVKIPETEGTWTKVREAAGTEPELWRWVREITVTTSKEEYEFNIYGVEISSPGATVNLVLSPVDHYVYNGAGTLCEDFLTVPVACDAAPPPYVSVLVDGVRSATKTPPVGAAYNKRVAAVQVRLSEACDHDVTVTLKPSIKCDATKPWTDYIGLSEYTEGGAHDGKTTVTFTKAEQAAGTLMKAVQLYALGSDANTVGPDPSHAVTLEAEVDTASQSFYTGDFETAVVYLSRTNPVITKPTYGESFPDIQGGTTYSFQLKVDDTYKNASAAAPSAGYTIYVKTGATGSSEQKIDCPSTADKTWHLNSDGTLKENDGKLSVKYDIAGTYMTEIRVVAPDSQKSTYTGGTEVAPVKVNVTVSEPATVEPVVTAKTYNEGAIMEVNFKLSRAYSKTVYAFLVPKGDATNLVSGTDTGVLLDGYAIGGAEIAQGDTLSTGTVYAELLDGKAKPSGTTLSFDVVLCENGEYKESEKVSGFISKGLTVKVYNVEPGVKEVKRAAGGSVKWTSSSQEPEFPIAVAKGVAQQFTISNLSEPGTLDKKSMNMEWSVEEYDTTGRFVTGYTTNFTGKASDSTNKFNYTFLSAGQAKIAIRVWDKDMDPDSVETSYNFKVNVSGSPAISIAENGASFNEMDSSGKLTVNMSASATDTIIVRAKVEPYETSDDPGRFILDPTKRVNNDPTKGLVTTNEYFLTFKPGTSTAMQDILTFSELDGTLGSQSKGFRVTLSVDTNAMKEAGIKLTNPDGIPYNEYFLCEEGRIYVFNEAPSVVAPAENPITKDTDKGYIVQLGVNTSRAISFTISNDAKADLAAGFNVTFICSGCNGTLDGVKYTGTTNVTAGTHTFIPDFTAQGAQTITLQIVDKDSLTCGTPVFERTWNYYVEASKMLRLTPHGPHGGWQTSPLSQRYAGFVGEGHVYSTASNPGMTKFNLSYNCGSADSADIYAFGYKNDGSSDNGTLDGGYDIAIDSEGTATKGPDYYKYAGSVDSFFYRWVLVKGGGENAAEDMNTIAPERAAGKKAQGSVTLPKKEESDKEVSYVETVLEAVFSKELFWSDNVGDMNQDGIPDIMLVHGWKADFGGLVDASTGKLTGNDMTKLSAFNDDADMLPRETGFVGESLIPESSDKWTLPFTARLEIRGQNDHLNDALSLLSETGVKPNRVYEVDDGSGKMVYDAEKCTISYLEYLAWKDSGLAADKWSPERPTDPTTEDTDEDGLPDGYEYFFWYRAHVGYMENGEHKYLTGRRYNPADPANPILITSAEIAAACDPRHDLNGAAQAQDWEKLDTDNDGLTDYEEYVKGTNPFDYDTDQDGLPDGYEVYFGGSEKKLRADIYATGGGLGDGLKNPDGDAMTFEVAENRFMVFGFAKPDGTVAYRAIDRHALGFEGFKPVTAKTGDGETPVTCQKITLLDSGTVLYTTVADLMTKIWTDAEGVKRLRTDLPAAQTWAAQGEYLGQPTFIARGTKIVGDPEDAEAKTLRLTMTKDDGTDVTDGEFGIKDGTGLNRLYAAFRYGERKFAKDSVTPEYGLFAVCGDTSVDCSWPIVYISTNDTSLIEETRKKSPVYLVHHFSYQQSGFDPRAGWKTGNAKSRAFNTYDEYLALAVHRAANERGLGTGLFDSDLVPTTTRPWSTIWSEYMTDPFSADTDQDGLPDGWELYVMAGPKTVLPKPDDKIPCLAAPSASDAYGPLSSYATVADKTKPDNDGLDFWQEFCGVDTLAAVANLSTVADFSAAGEFQASGWRNKKYATDPWNADTDDDGIKDGDEGKLFVYGDKTATGVAGGGLNPCSWDTDSDGLPDPWEEEFAGKYDETSAKFVGVDGTVNDAMEDFDHDGLLNWQEYMVGSMRCWRYDDTFSSWGMQAFAATEIKAAMGSEAAWGQYWYERLVCKPDLTMGDLPAVVTQHPESFEMGGEPRAHEYNPRLVDAIFDAGANYFSLCTNEWDTAHGGWYMFRDGVYHDLSRPGAEWLYKDGDNKYQFNRFSWWAALREPMTGYPFYYTKSADKLFIYPTKYICCDPNKADTDNDGMDDYYELFHGMNPLLGLSEGYDDGLRPPVDIVFEAYGGGTMVMESDGSLVHIWSAENNFWLNAESPNEESDTGAKLARTPVSKTGSTYDFVAYPWLTGLATADVDGDNIRNQEEAIMPNLQSASSWHHTDPTPLWLTDFSYTNSLTHRYYRPVSAMGWSIGYDTPYFEYDVDGDGEIDPKTERWDIRSFPGYSWTAETGVKIVPYVLHKAWGPKTTIYSFEENEGYDSDHDYLSDYEEAQGKTKPASDPQDSDDPLRRQAMWFGGDANKGFLQTPLQQSEYAPVDQLPMPTELPFLYFTVECWARPDDACDLTRQQTIVERAIWSGNASSSDEKLLRKNFLIGIRNGKWYAKYDSSGTEKSQPVEINDGPLATKKWTHLAATFDGTALRLYVNGVCNNKHDTSVAPAHGMKAVTVDAVGELTEGTSFYTYSSLLVGASAASFKGIVFDYQWRNPDKTATTIADYADFYHGYVDELRIWDGARTETQVLADYKKRYSKDDCSANRDQCLSAWQQNATFTAASETLRPAELRYHFTFDHLPGAVKAADVLKTPAGFVTAAGIENARARHWSRPDDYACTWWDMTDVSIKPTVYNNFSWVPWIGNTVAHLPRPDGTTLDSVYWSKDYAGEQPALALGYTSFGFPMTAEYASRWTQMMYVTQKQPPDTTPTRYELIKNNSALLALYSYTLRHRMTEGEDLLPFGGAYPKRISLTEGGMWDEQGAADAWAETDADADYDGLPDWWQQYARIKYNSGVTVTWATVITYDGVQMPAYLAYKRDLAKGMLPDKKYHAEYADTKDQDGDGIPDWWEEMYGVQGNSVADAMLDPDKDGLSNYAEYLLSEVYPKQYGLTGRTDVVVRALNPRLAYSLPNQAVTDYFLRYSSDGDNAEEIKNSSGESCFLLTEYFGEISTDHDFVENWWENKYNYNYSSSYVFDPHDDKDEDGWSNWAECRAALWGGSFNAELIDSWTGMQSEQHIVDYPEPILGVRATYHGVQDISGRTLVIRTSSGQSQRVDATFRIPASLDSQRRFIGTFVGNNVLHGHLSPGMINPNSIIFYCASVSSDKSYLWNCDWYQANEAQLLGWDYDHYGDQLPWGSCSRTHSGNIEKYMAEFRTWPKIELEGGDLVWEVLGSTRQSSDTTVEFIVNNAVAGSVNIVTGEYTINMDQIGRSVDDCVFSVEYTSRVGHEWPQTVYLSDTKELSSDEVVGALGEGHVREGRNIIEAFMDLGDGKGGEPDGIWEPGEPYGAIRNVLIGWHKLPTVVIEMRDDSSIMPGVSIASGEDDEQEQSDSNEKPLTSSLQKTIRIARRYINGKDENEGKRLTQRPLLVKQVVIDDRPYLTEADVVTIDKPDLDWTWLQKDAAKFGIENVETVTYSVDEVTQSVDGTTENKMLATFVKTFNPSRAIAKAVSPVENAPVYSCSPKMTFSASDLSATGYRLQIQNVAGVCVYDSGYRLLPGRTGSTVGQAVYEVTPPVFADMKVYSGTTTNHLVFADGSNYKWRVALVNAKFNSVAEDDVTAWSDWAAFQMDVNNVNRYPLQTTGYGTISAAVRYYGPTNVVPAAVIVEAFANADFSGQPLAQAKLTGDASLIADVADVTTVNATLCGVAPGKSFFRAYFDQNGNGIHDQWETWGYANMVGKSLNATFNPLDFDWLTDDKNTKIVIYMEDCDVNRNEWPDVLESANFSEDIPYWKEPENVQTATDALFDTDGDGMPDVWENWNAGITDPLVADGDTLPMTGTDVMAYLELDGQMVTIDDGSTDGLRLLLADGQTYRSQDGKVASNYVYTTWYQYGVASKESPIYGVGTNVVITNAWNIKAVDSVTVALVHAQVYSREGYSPLTANAEAFTNGTAVNTKEFTALDRYLTMRYFEAIGATPTNYPSKYGSYETYALNKGSEEWKNWTLMPGTVDANNDFVADGWELYVMYGTNLTVGAKVEIGDRGKVSPWGGIADTTKLSPGGEGLSWRQEYDEGNAPTDPWSANTLFSDINDADAYEYQIKTAGTQLDDEDHDGLSNWAEYLAYKAGFGKFDVRDAMTDGKTLDYFKKVTTGPYAGRYVGEAFDDLEGHLIADHDFIEDWWEDIFDVAHANRYRYDALEDADEDGWSNWAEARAGTEPDGSARLSLVKSDGSEDHTVENYPIPTLRTTLTYLSDKKFDKSVTIKAWHGTATTGEPDAVWTVPGSGEKSQWNTRFLSLAPNVVMDLNIGPGDVAQSHVMLEFYDPNYTIENVTTYTNGDKKTTWTLHNIDTARWGNFYFGDDPTDTTFGRDTGTIAYHSEDEDVDSEDSDEGSSSAIGEAIVGSWVNYRNGDTHIDFTCDLLRQTDAVGPFTAEKGSGEIKEIRHYPHYDLTRAFWRLRWMGRMAEEGNTKRISLSKPDMGHLKEGLNTFVAYICDAEGNGGATYTASSPFAVARNVDVGWNKVTDLTFAFNDKKTAWLAFNDAAVGEGRIKVLRTEINGEPYVRTVWAEPKDKQTGLYTSADFVNVSLGELDTDWAKLTGDAAYLGIPADKIRSATYVLVRGSNVVDTITRMFDEVRTIPNLVSPTADKGNVLCAVQPTFVWKGSDNATAFVLQLSDDPSFPADRTLERKALLPANLTDGRTFKTDWYVGEELEDGQTYYWRVAELNAKWKEAEGGWSETGTFRTAIDSTNANTGYGKLAADVRYYGPAADPLSHVVVAVYETADFTGLPVARKSLAGRATVASLAKKSVNEAGFIDAVTNVVFDGIAPGSYYVMAFIDTNGNGRREPYETWGYVNRVGGTSASLYQPVELTVVSAKKETPSAILFMEDTDVNNTDVPDCLEDMTDWTKDVEDPMPDYPAYGEDEDGTGQPEEWTDSFSMAVAPEDVMAYADLEGIPLVKVGSDELTARWYAVMDLANEAAKIADSDITVGMDAAKIASLVTTWSMTALDPTVKGEEPYIGIGTNVTFAADQAKVWDKTTATVRLVHAQVYAKFGYETGCAAICADNNDPRLEAGILAAAHPHTKAFTATDKYMVCRYLENIGVEGVSETNLIRRAHEAEQKGLDSRSIWLEGTLDPSEIDGDRDGIADGWELYTMFGQTGLKAFVTKATFGMLAAAKVSPFNAADGLKLTATTWAAPGADRKPEDGLTLVEEFDGGYYPTDPWSVDTDVDTVIDYYAYQYHLKGDDAGKDFDLDENGKWTGDGLSNYAEYLISEVFQFTKLDPDQYATSGGVCDYFRKVGELYLGEIFMDHDQVDDAWERTYASAANMYVYDPARDDDGDGWSNWAESKANTDPSTGESSVLITSEGSYSRPEYPVPVVKAKVVYHGKNALPSNLVFKAWSEADKGTENPTSYRMTCVADGMWTVSSEAAGARSRYLGRMPSVSQQYALSGGSVALGTFKLKVLNQEYVRSGFADTNNTNTVQRAVETVGVPEEACWYLAANDDGSGEIVTMSGVTVGKIDYRTGLVTIDFSNAAFDGVTYGSLRGDKTAYANSQDGKGQLSSFDRFTFAGSHVLVEWQAKQPGPSVDGTYYLCNAACKLREGKNSFICYASEDGSTFVPGQPFGVVRGVDVGWQGASFTIELSDTSAITPRVDLWNSAESDRSIVFSEYSTMPLYDRTATPEQALALSNKVKAVSAEADATKARLRVVRFGVNGMYAYRAGVGFNVSNFIDRVFDVNGRSYLCEADFLQDGEFDIEWSTLNKQVIMNQGTETAVGEVTNMTYLAVLEGGSGFETWIRGAGDSNTTIRALATTIERRFEKTKHAPKAENVDAICYAARPTFRWSLPNEEAFAKKYGTSYTAFKLKIFAEDGVTKIYDSGVRRAPAQDANGVFSWTAEASVGDLLATTNAFATTGNYTWQVAMYNAKFIECTNDAKYTTEDKKWKVDKPSALVKFSVAVNAQQEMNGHQYSSIDVAVKYAGPSDVIADYANLGLLEGKVRVQAFATADFAGEPLCETVVTADVDDLGSNVANTRLIGLESMGTYYIRAYIDSNGNHQRDVWESWGAARSPVVLTTSNLTAPLAAVWIEDCDVDNDWLPDAWEYVMFGEIATAGADVMADGKTILTTETTASAKFRLTSISTGLEGASLTIFENGSWAKTLLGLRGTESITFDDIRAAVQQELDVKADTFKITSMTLGADGKVTLAVDAEVTPTIAGELLTSVYDVTPGDKKTVKLQVYKRTSLAQAGWGDPLKHKDTTVGSPTYGQMIDYYTEEIGAGKAEITVDVGVTPADLKSGFYKIDIVE